MSSNIGFSGISSGLNTNGLIANIQRFSQQSINSLNATVTADQSKQTALQGIQSTLQALQNDASQLALTQGSVFDGKTVSSSNSSLVTAAAGTSHCDDRTAHHAVDANAMVNPMSNPTHARS